MAVTLDLLLSWGEGIIHNMYELVLATLGGDPSRVPLTIPIIDGGDMRRPQRPWRIENFVDSQLQRFPAITDNFSLGY